MRWLRVPPTVLLLLVATFPGCAAREKGKHLNNPIFLDFSAQFELVREGVTWVRVVYQKMDRKSKQNILEKASGSGIIITSRRVSSGEYESEIITNYHVIAHAKKILVYLFTGGKPYWAQVEGFDDVVDLALLRIRTIHKLRSLPAGDVKNLKIGEPVFVVGNPHNWTWSFAGGFIGNLWKDPLVDTIQFDGAINFGNSGGGLFNLRGELIGVPLEQNKNGTIGFAIAVSTIEASLPHLRKGGRVPHGFLGVKVYSVDYLDEDNMEDEASPSAELHGVEVAEVQKGMPADVGGLMVGDIILEVSGQAVMGSRHFEKLVVDSQIGKPVPLKILRNGEEMTHWVVPSEIPLEE